MLLFNKECMIGLLSAMVAATFPTAQHRRCLASTNRAL